MAPAEVLAAFKGKFKVTTRDNFDAFMTGLNIPAEHIEAARNADVTVEMNPEGEKLTITRTRPKNTTCNTFEMGKATKIKNMQGDGDVEVMLSVEGNKLVAEGENYKMVMEMDGNNLKETITVKGNTMTRISTPQ